MNILDTPSRAPYLKKVSSNARANSTPLIPSLTTRAVSRFACLSGKQQEATCLELRARELLASASGTGTGTHALASLRS